MCSNSFLSEDSDPTIHSTPSSEAVIGRAYETCLEGNSGGTNGNNFWTFDGTHVNSIDISGLTNHGNSNITHPTPAICDICSCYKEYLSVEEIKQRVEAELERTGFASFLVTMYQLDRVVSPESRLCYGVPDRFLSVLMIRSVRGAPGGQAEASFTITSADNRATFKPFRVPTSEPPILIPTS